MRVCIFYITSGKRFPCKFLQGSLIRSILENQNLPFRIFYFIVPTTQEFLIVLGNFCCFTISRNYHIAPLLKLSFVVLTLASPLVSFYGFISLVEFNPSCTSKPLWLYWHLTRAGFRHSCFSFWFKSWMDGIIIIFLRKRLIWLSQVYLLPYDNPVQDFSPWVLILSIPIISRSWLRIRPNLF